VRRLPAFFSAALAVLCTLVVPSPLAADWGVIVSEQFEAGLDEGEKVASKTILAPWLSLPLGERADLYLSAGVSAYYRGEDSDFFPELFRLELSVRPVSGLTLRAGRIDYQDPTLFTAKGRFDGADIAWAAGALRLSAGAYYTGLLYRNTADITATPGDPVDYAAALDYGDFADTYGAPRRALASLGFEYAGLLVKRGTLYGGYLYQHDFSDAPEKRPGHYLLLRYVLSIPGGFDVAAAGGAAFMGKVTNRAALAGTLEGGWRLPGARAGRLSLGARWASGEGSSTTAWFPVVTEAQGTVIEAGFSGLMALAARWEARLLSGISGELGLRYFLRTDLATFDDPWLEEKNKSYLLGLEPSGSLLWMPFSDISLRLGGGVFLPRTGGAFRDGAPVYWRLTLGAVVSL
jgi:hypothetical protein